MSGDFLDSNVFVYTVDNRDTRKRDIARSVIEGALASGDGFVSHQVVQETLNVVTSKIKFPLSADDAARFLDGTLAPLWRVLPTVQLFSVTLQVRARYGFHFYDSLIIAAALAGGCDRLLSEDFQHGQVIDGLTIHNPFL